MKRNDTTQIIIIKNVLFLSKKNNNKALTLLLTNTQKCADKMIKPLSHLLELWLWRFWRTLIIRRHNSIKEILNYDQRYKHVNINECKLHCSVLHGYCLKVANKTPESAQCAQVFTICPLCSPPLIFRVLSLRSVRYRSPLQHYPPEALLRQQTLQIHPLPFSDASINIWVQKTLPTERKTPVIINLFS